MILQSFRLFFVRLCHRGAKSDNRTVSSAGGIPFRHCWIRCCVALCRGKNFVSRFLVLGAVVLLLGTRTIFGGKFSNLPLCGFLGTKNFGEVVVTERSPAVQTALNHGCREPRLKRAAVIWYCGRKNNKENGPLRHHHHVIYSGW